MVGLNFNPRINPYINKNLLRPLPQKVPLTFKGKDTLIIENIQRIPILKSTIVKAYKRFLKVGATIFSAAVFAGLKMAPDIKKDDSQTFSTIKKAGASDVFSQVINLVSNAIGIDIPKSFFEICKNSIFKFINNG